MSDQTTPSEDKASDNDDRPSGLGKILERRPIAFALAFEGALALVAIVLALIFGLRPWLTVVFDIDAVVWFVPATVLMVVAALAVMQLRWRWVKDLARIVREHLLPLFRDAGPIAVFGVALMAGIGEELLFRGVIQAGLSGLVGPFAALALASLLFGLAHALSKAYFILTCVMGLYLGWLYQVTGNLLVPITVHFLYDWIVLSWYLYGARR